MFKRLDSRVMLLYFLVTNFLVQPRASGFAAAAMMDLKGESPIQIAECFKIAKSEGVYEFSEEMIWKSRGGMGAARSVGEAGACAFMILAPYDMFIQILGRKVDADCENRDFITAIDGWGNMDGEMFPSDLDHPLAKDERLVDVCELGFVFHSNQNVAMLDFKVGAPGSRFVVDVSFHKLNRVCNAVMLAEKGLETELRLRSGLRPSNCSILIINPVKVTLIMTKMITRSRKSAFRTRSRTDYFGNYRRLKSKNRCDKSDDYLDILGGRGFDPLFMKLKSRTCQSLPNGPASNNVDDGYRSVNVGCPYTVLRLVSSGAHNNLVTVRFERSADAPAASTMADDEFSFDPASCATST